MHDSLADDPYLVNLGVVEECGRNIALKRERESNTLRPLDKWETTQVLDNPRT